MTILLQDVNAAERLGWGDFLDKYPVRIAPGDLNLQEDYDLFTFTRRHGRGLIVAVSCVCTICEVAPEVRGDTEVSLWARTTDRPASAFFKNDGFMTAPPPFTIQGRQIDVGFLLPHLSTGLEA